MEVACTLCMTKMCVRKYDKVMWLHRTENSKEPFSMVYEKGGRKSVVEHR